MSAPTAYYILVISDDSGTDRQLRRAFKKTAPACNVRVVRSRKELDALHPPSLIIFGSDAFERGAIRRPAMAQNGTARARENCPRHSDVRWINQYSGLRQFRVVSPQDSHGRSPGYDGELNLTAWRSHRNACFSERPGCARGGRF